MAESEQTDGRHEASEETDRQLKLLRFDPGIPVFEMRGDITLEQVQRALFESTYNKPVVVPFTYINTDPGSEPATDRWALPMLVEFAQAVYTPFSLRVGETPVGCWEHPCWYLRGFLGKSAFDPYPETLRMHVWLSVEPDEGGIETGIIQLVRHPSGADPHTRIVFSQFGPGEAA
jgi:hypothetical protein